MKIKDSTIDSLDNFKESMLKAANEMRVSDIHIDPGPDEYLIRFRIDGVLRPWIKSSMTEFDTLLSYFKVASNVDITEHNVPQDGHFIWVSGSSDGEAIDVRTSFFPVVYGQAIVFRLLNRKGFLVPTEELFDDRKDLELIREIMHRPYGMILVSGPANSGKSTTMYSLLKELSSDDKNIITLEDPVEYYLPNIRQSQIKEAVNYTLATGLRSILRQDPDITMIGEIRDYETADNALRSSLTGRLFFTTIHANDSIGTITRLVDMQLKKDLVAYALSAVIAQRLVKQICNSCKEEYSPDESVLKTLNLNSREKFYHGKGCEVCSQTGFKGRVRLYEILIVDNGIKEMIISGSSYWEIYKYATERGLKTLRNDGIEKIRQGITTPEEVILATA